MEEDQTSAQLGNGLVFSAEQNQEFFPADYVDSIIYQFPVDSSIAAEDICMTEGPSEAQNEIAPLPVQNYWADNHGHEAVCYDYSAPATVTILDEGVVPGGWVFEAIAMTLLPPVAPKWIRTNRETSTNKLVPAPLRHVPWDVRAKNLLMYFGGSIDSDGWFSHAMLVFFTKESILEITRQELQVLLKNLFAGGWHKDVKYVVDCTNGRQVPVPPYRRISPTLLGWHRDFVNGSKSRHKAATTYLTLTRVSHFNTYEGCVNLNLHAIEYLQSHKDRFADLVPDDVEFPELVT
ncbi:uncharacterized protein LOC129582903 [Paramacrobiotus metropolitanus]|uniref:uncharacterized protein LOC129582903 n=1 Tax=Paramacrobiotus metropolitanus TaxID=2943436 RepID=UPI002446131F|nr:uncharacterized protein LOC129582903 [Paramacrobiotus metropolitanus]